MILVDPARVIIGCCLLSFVMFAMGLWMGNRLGYARGLATWRKSYRRMTPKEVAEHKAIISQMVQER